MNITTTISPSQAGRSTRRHGSAILVAALLGMAAIAGGTYGLTRDSDAAPAPQAGATISLPPLQERPLTVYYIVASLEEADVILAGEAAAQMERDVAGNPGLPRDVHFFVVTNAEEEQQVWDTLGGVDEFVRIVDTRYPMIEIRSSGVLPTEGIGTAESLSVEGVLPAEDIAAPAPVEAADPCAAAGPTDPEGRVLLANFCE